MEETPTDFREIQLTIKTHQTDQRLDSYLAKQIGNLSRSRIRKLIDGDLITINDERAKPSHLVKWGEEVIVRIPGPKPSPLTAEAIPLDICYEDSHLIVVNKPAGMVVHPAYGHPSGTLVNALLYHCQDLAGIGGEMRPGLVHRIDKDTSGLLVVAKTEQTLSGLSKQFKKKTSERLYKAIVWGHLQPPEGRVDAPLGRSPRDRKIFSVVQSGKTAATKYWTLERFELFSLLQLQLETGRTHQIRIHMLHAGHPVLGDPQYGGRNRRLGPLTSAQRRFVAEIFEILPRQALHAAVLSFIHPATGETLRFESEFPEDIQQVLQLIRSRNRH
ncbi:RNA pseudouridine synthase [candidate division LCP-89 bacterium B3_LCP]|uniref:Pseudouridine synthase n=1 Tax=candidate division LCP-89 bacterium B3_LCP TaxID=2012998 RepID=A0A532V000_UNCL8|nr:MAG: RNA pseudouridine synthase [candidate division LCP-89 bacterium B3_LCP]